jgi:hypothetical protein
MNHYASICEDDLLHLYFFVGAECTDLCGSSLLADRVGSPRRNAPRVPTG